MMKVFKYLFVGLIIVCVIFRLALPTILLHVVEKRMNTIPHYKTSIQSIDVSLYRGSYQINKITINKINKNIPVPFFSAQIIDLAVEWRALLHGAFVAKITVYKPNMNLVMDPVGKNEQLSMDSQWREIVTSLFPLNINQIRVKDGSIHYRSFNSKPPFDIFFKNIEGNLTNLQNVNLATNALPSHLQANALTMNNAPVNLKIEFNPFLHQPTFYLTAELKNMTIADTNNFLQYYTKLRVKSGLFSLYVETKAAKGKISGYVKPLFTNLALSMPKTNNPVRILYTAAASATATLLTNYKTEAVATKINITGSLNDPNTSVLSIIGYLLQNAFIQALLPGIDHDISKKDIVFK